MLTAKPVMLIVAVAALLVASMMPPLVAQEQNVIQGQLVRVDTDAKTIVIKTETGSEMKFSYNDDTEIIGSDESPAGLGTVTNADVTVRYVKRDEAMFANRIEVHKRS